MKVGDTVEIKDATGPGNWHWLGRTGEIIKVERYQLTVLLPDEHEIRDFKEHFRLCRK